MDGIIYIDVLAALIRRVTFMLSERDEPFASDVEVSNRKSSELSRAVVLTVAPGGGTADTLRTSYVTVDVICRDEFEAVDLINLVLALATSRGNGGMVDGKPFTRAAVNGGPNEDYAADGWFKQTAQLEVGHRGRNLV
ncbi:hypothetical protein [Frigoribacterium faeni]|uniref:Uncharacterized protein n=1 Tax=Frigoribacterium faeni TaxID=145483 RepID=A0A7W3PIH4_9MICO|nr:hypothetical protein [Frigoribacterium faeni]MBA8812669.1 hypothetical protein [Frigoribacterium faeni]BFF13779.1 hypothetical protein GCM10025699_50820 [Microbacterium flavescens]GEK82318.1 hypothetical protein FFA01_06270 [Frigoribacterium faeni]